MFNERLLMEIEGAAWHIFWRNCDAEKFFLAPHEGIKRRGMP
jgi:hypothetical protein